MAYKKTEIKLGTQTFLKLRDENDLVCFGWIFFFDTSLILGMKSMKG